MFNEDSPINEISSACGFSIEPETEIPYNAVKISLNDAQRMGMNNLLQYLPQATASGLLAKAYVMKFPKGVTGTLMRLRQGGVSTVMRDANKHYSGTASLFSMEPQAAVLGAFTVMSAVTGQYFLAEINKGLALSNEKLDTIINFLYGENKAELLAEITFTRFAHENFSSIMLHDMQRLSTIQNLQTAQKTAIKDIEFYMSDLEAVINTPSSDYAHIGRLKQQAFRALECIEMARQVYATAAILELYYAENYDPSYIAYVKDAVTGTIRRCDNQILSSLTALEGKYRSYRARPMEHVETRESECQHIKAAKKPYMTEKDSELYQAVCASLNAIGQPTQYYLDSDGNIYQANV